MFNTIVVGTDGSKRASIAVDHAIALAKASGAHLHVVHAVSERQRDPAIDTATRAQLEMDQAYDVGDAVTAVALARSEARGLSGKAHAPRGDPADALIAIAHAENADLVVVGNQGMGGLRGYVLGSVPDRIAHKGPCNLLIVDTEGQADEDVSGAARGI